MTSIRYLAACCALTFAASASAGTSNSAFLAGADSAPSGVSETKYWEKLDGVVTDMPAQGFTYPSMSIHYAGATTTGVVARSHDPALCKGMFSGGYVGGADGVGRVDISLDFNAPSTNVYFPLCAPLPLKEDVTVEFVAADGTSVQKNVFEAGQRFNELVDYSGSKQVIRVLIRASGQVHVDHIHHTSAN
jgi:hypothetical protein